MFCYLDLFSCRELILLMVLFQAGLTDMGGRRISNLSVGAGLVFLLPLCSPEEVLRALLVSMSFLLLWRLGMLGAGDIKLFLLIFLAKGLHRGGGLIFIGLIIGAAAGVYSLVSCGQLLKRVKRLLIFFIHLDKEGGRYIGSEDSAELTVPLAACMFLAELMELVIWSR